MAWPRRIAVEYSSTPAQPGVFLPVGSGNTRDMHEKT